MSSFLPSGDGRYIYAVPEQGIEFDVDRLRRERHQLIGELTVRSRLTGTPQVVSVADFNLSSDRTRTDKARKLDALVKASEIDWHRLIEDLCQQVLEHERRGQPAVFLRDLERPLSSDQTTVQGITLLERHPVIIFGDGGSAKSYLGLYLAGHLEQNNISVLYADWEFAGEDHRDRLERLFGEDMPAVRYVRCDRPLVAEKDRIRRLVKAHDIGFVIYDSIAFATDGPPESAESAADYFRACREVNAGSLHIAHVTKGDSGDQKPFGSTFWHNGARATWYIQRSDTSDAHSVTLGLFNRKTNVGPLHAPVGFHIEFGRDRTTFTPCDVKDVTDLSAQLPLWVRIQGQVQRRSMTLASLAETLDAKVDTVEKAVKRRPGTFARIEGPDGVSRIGLVERRYEQA